MKQVPNKKGEIGMRPLYLKGKEGSKDLVCYVPGGVYWGAYGRITGPDSGWVDARDLTFCKRINNEMGFGVYCRGYDVRWHPEQPRGA